MKKQNLQRRMYIRTGRTSFRKRQIFLHGPHFFLAFLTFKGPKFLFFLEIINIEIHYIEIFSPEVFLKNTIKNNIRTLFRKVVFYSLFCGLRCIIQDHIAFYRKEQVFCLSSLFFVLFLRFHLNEISRKLNSQVIKFHPLI